MGTFIRTGVMGVIATAFTTLFVAPAGAVMIDDFSTGNHTVSAGGGATVTDEVDGIMIGGERDVSVTNLGAGGLVSALNSGGPFSYGSQLTTGSATITWDGNDDSPALDTSGLGSIDFTDGGISTALAISVVSNDFPVTLTFTIYTGGASSSASVMTTGGPGVYSIPFASFVGGADFTDVGAVQAEIDAPISDTDVAFDFVQTVPEPATAAQLMLGLVGLGWVGRRRSA